MTVYKVNTLKTRYLIEITKAIYNIKYEVFPKVNQ